jgi:hypothetical protein
MKGIWLILISVLFNVLGQLSMKYAMIKSGEINFRLSRILNITYDLLTKPFILLGLATYGIGSIFWVITLSKVDLSLHILCFL